MGIMVSSLLWLLWVMQDFGHQPYIPCLPIWLSRRPQGSAASDIGSLVVPFWGLPYRILNVNHKRELLRGLWVLATSEGRKNSGPCFPMRLQCDAKSGSNYSAVSL